MRRLLLAAMLFLLLAPAAQAETLHYRYGPVHIAPGRNDIVFAPNDLKPAGRRLDHRVQAEPDVRANGEIPRVDVVHLHHGVWISNCAPLFAAGEEKTTINAAGGLRLALPDERRVADEPHDPQPHADADRRLHRLRPRVRPGHGAGGRGDEGGPDAVPGRDRASRPTRCSTSTAARAAGTAATRTPTSPACRGYTRTATASRTTACWSAPPATCTRAASTRTSTSSARGRSVRLFRSRAKYFEPAGAVSWDVAMEATPADWRVGVKARRHPQGVGDVRHQASVVVRVDGDHGHRRSTPAGPGRTRSPSNVDVRGQVTHGHLPENRNHGGTFSGLADPRRLLSAPPPPSGTIGISDFVYGRGDLLRTGRGRRPPTIRPGGTLRFVNRDADKGDPALDHLVPRAVQPHDRHRLPARGRAGPVRLRQPRLRSGVRDRRREPRHVADAARPARRHLHVLLQDPPVHARRVPRQGPPEGVIGAR